eukprot:14024914-Alexandrium_andersonii.AAC.1
MPERAACCGFRSREREAGQQDGNCFGWRRCWVKVTLHQFPGVHVRWLSLRRLADCTQCGEAHEHKRTGELGCDS